MLAIFITFVIAAQNLFLKLEKDNEGSVFKKPTIAGWLMLGLLILSTGIAMNSYYSAQNKHRDELNSQAKDFADMRSLIVASYEKQLREDSISSEKYERLLENNYNNQITLAKRISNEEIALEQQNFAESQTKLNRAEKQSKELESQNDSLRELIAYQTSMIRRSILHQTKVSPNFIVEIDLTFYNDSIYKLSRLYNSTYEQIIWTSYELAYYRKGGELPKPRYDESIDYYNYSDLATLFSFKRQVDTIMNSLYLSTWNELAEYKIMIGNYDDISLKIPRSGVVNIPELFLSPNEDSTAILPYLARNSQSWAFNTESFGREDSTLRIRMIGDQVINATQLHNVVQKREELFSISCDVERNKVMLVSRHWYNLFSRGKVYIPIEAGGDLWFSIDIITSPARITYDSTKEMLTASFISNSDLLLTIK